MATRGASPNHSCCPACAPPHNFSEEYQAAARGTEGGVIGETLPYARGVLREADAEREGGPAP